MSLRFLFLTLLCASALCAAADTLPLTEVAGNPAANIWDGQPSPRTLSLVLGSSLNPSDAGGRSAYVYAWGQAVDHDITLTQRDPEGASHPIEVDPVSDPHFTEDLPFVHRRRDENGHVVNNRTPLLDATIVRGPVGSRLGCVDGLLEEDPTAPGFPVRDSETGEMIFGDERGNEQPGLASTHILLFRENQRRAREQKVANPEWTSQQLCDDSEKWVRQVWQHITADEWLPAITGGQQLPPLPAEVADEQGISILFAGATYRLHSIVPERLALVSHKELEWVSIGGRFHRPDFIRANFPRLASGLAHARAAAFDFGFAATLRHRLLGRGDLIANNIARGREFGLPGWLTARAAAGLDNEGVDWPSEAVQQAYGGADDPDKCDVFVCMHYEPKGNGGLSLLGELSHAMLVQTLTMARDQDPEWWERDPLAGVNETSLAWLIERHTPRGYYDGENAFMWSPVSLTVRARSLVGTAVASVVIIIVALGCLWGCSMPASAKRPPTATRPWMPVKN